MEIRTNGAAIGGRLGMIGPIKSRMTEDLGWKANIEIDGSRATMTAEYRKMGKMARVGPVTFDGNFWIVDASGHRAGEEDRRRCYFSTARAALWTCFLQTNRVELVDQ